ncbi:MAG: hypothetical protein HeimC3_11320 [Candidatus Heimdallarchaeota archaeon LC_3]|nr:MAG: hypothetical protein HeimC3_11320 [Candidatus Heimdallarchaeota archaeon LC_3]
MGKILSVKKITKGSINLDDSIMDNLFLNEGDYLAFVEENNKIYIRKTRKPQITDENESNQIPTPPTFEEKSSEFSGEPNIGGNNILDAVQDALKNPEMMKMFQDTAKQLFSAFGDMGNVLDPNKAKKKVNEEDVEEDDDFEGNYDIDEDDDSDDDDSDNKEFKVKID